MQRWRLNVQVNLLLTKLRANAVWRSIWRERSKRSVISPEEVTRTGDPCGPGPSFRTNKWDTSTPDSVAIHSPANTNSAKWRSRSELTSASFKFGFRYGSLEFSLKEYRRYYDKTCLNRLLQRAKCVVVENFKGVHDSINPPVWSKVGIFSQGIS